MQPERKEYIDARQKALDLVKAVSKLTPEEKAQLFNESLIISEMQQIFHQTHVSNR